MSAIPLQYALILAGILFSLGLLGILIRRDILFVLMSIEIMMNAAALAFVTAGSRWGRADGQVMVPPDSDSCGRGSLRGSGDGSATSPPLPDAGHGRRRRVEGVSHVYVTLPGLPRAAVGFRGPHVLR